MRDKDKRYFEGGNMMPKCEIYNERITYIPQSTEVSVSYKFKTISRKRFIKLLISRKIQRNVANELAKYFLNKRGYYSYIDLALFDTGML